MYQLLHVGKMSKNCNKHLMKVIFKCFLINVPQL